MINSIRIHPARWSIATAIVGALAVLVWITGLTSAFSDNEETTGSAPRPPHSSIGPTKMLELSSLLGKSLKDAEDAIGRPSTDNTLPANLGENAPAVYSTLRDRAEPIERVLSSDLIVTTICVDQSKDRIFYGVVPKDRVTPEIKGDIETGGLFADFKLREATKCGASPSSVMIAIAVRA